MPGLGLGLGVAKSRGPSGGADPVATLIADLGGDTAVLGLYIADQDLAPGTLTLDGSNNVSLWRDVREEVGVRGPNLNPSTTKPVYVPASKHITFNGTTQWFVAAATGRMTEWNGQSRGVALVLTLPTADGAQRAIFEFKGAPAYGHTAYKVSGAPQELRLLDYGGAVALPSTYGPPPAGVRVMHTEMQAGPGGKCGMALGADARQQSVGTGTAENFTTFAIAQHLSAGGPGIMSLRLLVLYKGADWFTGGKQAILNTFAAAYLAATI